MLKQISTGKYNDNSLRYFTLSELILFSNVNKKILNIKIRIILNVMKYID